MKRREEKGKPGALLTRWRLEHSALCVRDALGASRGKL